MRNMYRSLKSFSTHLQYLPVCINNAPALDIYHFLCNFLLATVRAASVFITPFTVVITLLRP